VPNLKPDDVSRSSVIEAAAPPAAATTSQSSNIVPAHSNVENTLFQKVWHHPGLHGAINSSCLMRCNLKLHRAMARR